MSTTKNLTGYFLSFLKVTSMLIGAGVSLIIALFLLIGWALPFKLSQTALGALFLVLIGFFVAEADFKEDPPAILENNVLIFNLSGSITERSLDLGPLDFVDPSLGMVVLEDLLTVLRDAAHDERIQGIVLRLEGLSEISLLKIQAIGEELLRFKESGKSITAYGDYFTQDQYLLASYADQVFMNPIGSVSLAGFGSHRPYLKEALDNLGVKVNLFRSSKNKSAGEIFLQTEMSSSEKTFNLEIIDHFWSAYTGILKTTRGLESDSLNQLIAHPDLALQDTQGSFSQLALKAGLVDGLINLAQLDEYIDNLNQSSEPVNQLDYTAYAHHDSSLQPLSDGFLDDQTNKIALIFAEGIITDQADPGAGSVIAADRMINAMQEAIEDDQIKALVIRLNTPGGGVFASEIIRQELDLVKKAGKPVVVSMAEVAASGGYWIASSADQIWASKDTITGSIGVFTLVPTFEGLSKKLGVNVDGVSVGALPDAIITRDLTPAIKRWTQLGIDGIHQNFINLLISGRGLAPDAAAKVADGRVWTGSEAIKLNLVDDLGGLDEAVAAAAKLSKLDNWEVKRLSLWNWQDRLAEIFSQGVLASVLRVDIGGVAAIQLENQLQIDLAVLKNLLRNRQPQALCLSCRLGSEL